MRFFESANLRVITKKDDDVNAIRDLITSLLPIDWDKERIVLDESSFTDANDDERFIFELQLIKQRHVTAFTKHLISQLSKKVKEELLVEVTKQVDANSHFFVRFDLDALLKNEWILTLGGRCLHVNMAVCAHPRRQEVAINVVEKYLNQNDE